MGLDVSCRLVAGALLKDVYRKEKVRRTVDRWREETGEKYQKEVSEEVHHLGTKQMSWMEWKELLMGSEYSKGVIAKTGLDFFRVCSEDDDYEVVGILIAETESHRGSGSGCSEVDVDKCTDTLNWTAMLLEKHFGIERSKVKLYLVPEISC